MKRIRLKGKDKELELKMLKIYLNKNRREDALVIFYSFLSNENSFRHVTEHPSSLLPPLLSFLKTSNNHHDDHSSLLLLRKTVREILSRKIS